MKRLAIVRGPSLNPYAMQNFVLLKNYFSVKFFGTRKNKFVDKEVIKLWTINNKLMGILGTYYYQPFLMHALKKFNPHFTNSIELNTYHSYITVKYAHDNHKKSLVTCWETLPDNPLFKRRIFRRHAVRYIKKNATCFHTPTKRAKECLVSLGVDPQRIIVQKLGVDLSRFGTIKKESARKLFGIPNKTTILFVGRLSEEKGIREVITSFKKLKTKSQLVIVGDGPLKKYVLNNISKNVIYLSSQPYELMPNIHAMADIFCIHSKPNIMWEEQYGMVFLEAMATGTPIIATESGAIPEVVSNKEGILVKPGDVDALTNALKLLLSDESLRRRMGANGLKRALKEYDNVKVSNSLRKIFLNL